MEARDAADFGDDLGTVLSRCTTLQPLCEVHAADEKALVKVKFVGILAMRTHAGIKRDTSAAALFGKVKNKFKQAPGVAFAPMLFKGGEVVHIDLFAVEEFLKMTVADSCGCDAIFFDKGQFVAP